MLSSLICGLCTLKGNNSDTPVKHIISESTSEMCTRSIVSLQNMTFVCLIF